MDGGGSVASAGRQHGACRRPHCCVLKGILTPREEPRGGPDTSQKVGSDPLPCEEGEGASVHTKWRK